jgi:membrane protein implicated in regulation of membrane protease activity
MYVDPNTGGMIFQVLITVFTIASGFILVFSGKIRMLWARMIRRRSEKSAPADSENDGPQKN